MPNTKIAIDSAPGNQQGQNDGTDLVDFYFQLQTGSSNTYNFYDDNNTVVYTGVTSGTKFTFTLPGQNYNWTITPTISTSSASGTWSNTDHTHQGAAGDPGESGTFTAVATPPDEEAEDDDEASSAANA